MIKLLRGNLFFARIRITGRNIERVLSLTRAENVKLNNLTRVGISTVEADVSYKDYIKTVKSLNGKGFVIETVWSKGRIFLHLLSRRTVLFFGIPIAVALILIFSQRIYSVRVVGYNQTKIENLVKSNGFFTWKNDTEERLTELEHLIYGLDSKILWCNASVKGTVISVYVSCKKNEIPHTAEKGSSLVASKQAVVKSVTVTGGTGAVSVGQTVEAGQPLIYGQITQNGEIAECVPEGKVMASVYYCAGADVSAEDKYILTGNTYKTKSISFFGITAKENVQIPFAEYSVETESKSLFSLPIKIAETTYYEKKADGQYDLQELIDETEIALLSRLYSSLPEGASVCETKTVIKDNFGTVNVSVYVESIENIACEE